MKVVVVLLMMLLAGTVDAASSPRQGTAPTHTPSKYEKLALSMLPKEKLNRAQGFFGPVVKKHRPTFERFQGEFLAASNKREVIEKYLPDAELALADARAMKVPAKYESEKAEYLRMAETFMAVLRVTIAMGKRIERVGGESRWRWRK